MIGLIMSKLSEKQKKDRENSIRTTNQAIKELDYMNDCVDRGVKVDRRKTPVHNKWWGPIKNKK